MLGICLKVDLIMKLEYSRCYALFDHGKIDITSFLNLATD